MLITISRFYKRIKGQGIGAFFVRKASLAFFMNGASTFVGFITQIILTRFLGSVHYGDYIYVISWITILSLLASFGMNNTLLKHIGSYRFQEKWAELHGILRFANLVPLMTGIIIGSIAAFVVCSLQNRISLNLLYTSLIGCFLVPIYSLIQIRQSALRSLMFVVRSNLPERIIKPFLLMGLIFVAYWFFPLSLNAPVVMVLDGIAILIAFILGAIWLRNLVSPIIWQSPPRYCIREWMDVALPFLMLSSFQLIMGKTNIIMIGFFMGTEQAGFFSVASRIAAFISFSLQSVNTIYAPLISKLYTSGKMDDLQRITNIAAWGICLFSFPISILFIVFGKWILSIFGEEYTIAYIPLIILVVGQIINALTGSVGYLMNMTGYHKQSNKILSISIVINIFLNYGLINSLGLVGAAIATMITTMIWNLKMFFWVKNKLGINSSIFSRNNIGIFNR